MTKKRPMYHEWGDVLRVLSYLGWKNNIDVAKRNFKFRRIYWGSTERRGVLFPQPDLEGAGICSPMEVAIGSRLHWGRKGW